MFRPAYAGLGAPHAEGTRSPLLSGKPLLFALRVPVVGLSPFDPFMSLALRFGLSSCPFQQKPTAPKEHAQPPDEEGQVGGTVVLP